MPEAALPVGVGAEVEVQIERWTAAPEVVTAALAAGTLEVAAGVYLTGQEVLQLEVTAGIALAVEVFRQIGWIQTISKRCIRCLGLLGQYMQAVVYSCNNYCFFFGPSKGCVFQAFNC